MHHTNQPTQETRSVLRNLRSLIPLRPATFEEAKRIAELQANRLLSLFDVEAGAVPSEIVVGLPRIRVIYGDLPLSGTSHWSGTHWIITLNKSDAPVRQRFTLMHEFKHIIDHGHTQQLYHSNNIQTAADQAERAADHFAGCVLVPKRFLKRGWSHRIQSVGTLAQHFHVSTAAIEFRLRQTRISESHDCPVTVAAQIARCQRRLAPHVIAAYGAYA